MSVSRLGFASVVVVSMIAAQAHAKDLRRVMLQNTTGRDAAALELTFTEASGKVAIAGAPNVFPDRGSCGLPKLTLTKNVARVTWGSACVQPYQVVSFLAVSHQEPLTFANGAWIGPAGDTLGLIAAADVQVTTPENINQYPRPLVIAVLLSLLLDVFLVWLLVRKSKPKSATT